MCTNEVLAMFGSTGRPEVRTATKWGAVAVAAAAVAAALVVPPGAAAQAKDARQSAGGGASAGAALEGVWRSDGYQQYLTVHQGEMRSYEYSAAGCLPGRLRLTAGKGAPGHSGVPFRDKDGVRWLTLRTTGADNARLAPAGSVGEQRLERIAALPADCARPPAADPVHTFDVFWATLRENYPFLRAKGVDWDAMRAKYRPQVNAGTSDDRLFEILSAMIEPLHDMHTQLRDATGKRHTLNVRPGTFFGDEKYRDRVAAVTRAQLPEKVEEFADGQIQYADLGRGTGYLRVTIFAGYGGKEGPVGPDADAAILDRALAAVFTEKRVRAMRGLVVDLRLNGGGADALGIRIAGRLTDRAYTAYTKVARNDPDDPESGTPPQPIRVRPAAGPRFTGPVAVLGGPLTISAGESFAQSLMGRTPAPIRIGEPTQGVFSDTMQRALPNGWTLTVPNEKFLDGDGRTYDGTGIPPTHPEPVHAEADLANFRDPALKRALRELRAR
ncbi:S41 family peptidase [Streptomyces sp. NPDC021093]|uniref:S41 family peptidase n=1 Tax=Streptomyces sp. NPDC021093 TaxID=3365112 RepID=UPI0037A29B0A